MRGFSSAIAIAIALHVVLPPVVQAQDYSSSGDASAEQKAEAKRPKKKSAQNERKTKRSWARTTEVDERTQKRLTDATLLLVAEDYDGADKELDRLRMRGLNRIERAKVYRLRAMISVGREQYALARDFLEKAIAEDILEPQDNATMRFQIVQLYMTEGMWQEAVDNFEIWFTMEPKPNAGAYYMFALAHWQLGDARSALEPALKALKLSKKPREEWYQLVLAIRLTEKQYQEAIPILDALVAGYPKKDYWLQLSTVHGVLGSYEEALVPLQLAYAQGLMTEDSEVRRLAELMLFLDLPYRAAQVMETGLEEEAIVADPQAYEILSNSWIMAREYDRAVDPLERAAELAEGGGMYLRLAEVHIQREQWKEAAEALREALTKGDLPSTGRAQLLMGIAYFQQERPEEARKWFARAEKHADSEDEAKAWLQFIAREAATQAQQELGV